jgi:hypothetical protein
MPQAHKHDFCDAFNAAFARRRKTISYSTAVHVLETDDGRLGMSFERLRGTINVWIASDGAVDCSISCKRHRKKGLANCHITCHCADASRLVDAIEGTFLPLFEMDCAESHEVPQAIRENIETAWTGFDSLVIQWP